MAYPYQSTKLALVIDDNECVRTLLRIALKSDGLRVVEAGSGGEAIQKAEQLHLDLIVTDLEMPAGGFDHIRRLRALCPALPIIVISGIDSKAAKVQALASGGDLFLEKPFHLAELQTAIHRLLTTASAPDEEALSESVFVDSL
ncbi:hypothetical protein YTPLAS18_37120 [Nitrospira sp.]|nr:hypothetical protein YTPLAS18_37120 [Nitrospira sp.]